MIYKIFKALVKPFVGSGIGRNKFLAAIYQKIVVRLLPRENKVIEVQGFKFNIINDGYIGDINTEILFRGVHEPATTRLFKSLLKSGDTVIDIGANVGYFSLLAAQLVGKSGRVFAFEPETNNVLALTRNMVVNDFYNIKTYRLALSNRQGEARFYTSSKESAHHSLIQTKEHDGQTVTMMTRLDDLFITAPIALLKTDTEGNELAVLQGAERTLRANKNIKVIVEIYEDALNACGVTRMDVWQYLVWDLGFRFIYIIDDYKDKVKQIEYFPKHKMANNILCSREAICE